MFQHAGKVRWKILQQYTYSFPEAERTFTVRLLGDKKGEFKGTVSRNGKKIKVLIIKQAKTSSFIFSIIRHQKNVKTIGTHIQKMLI
jgi:hypothetical protein